MTRPIPLNIITIDRSMYIPPNTIGYVYPDEVGGGTTLGGGVGSDSDDSTDDSTDTEDPKDPTGGGKKPKPGLKTPTFSVLKQTLRMSVEGYQVVDVTLAVNDVPGAEHYDVRVTEVNS